MSIPLTERASEHVRSFTHGQNTGGLRLAVKPTGCSGYMYVVEITEEMKESDQTFESHGVRIIVDTESLERLAGTTVDFGRHGLNETFKFENPNVKETCGCGESFSL